MSRYDNLTEEIKLIKVDGLPNIIRSKFVVIKCIWCVILTCSAGICAWLIVQSVQDYLKYEVTTKDRLFSEQEAIFPTITICQINPFSTDYAVSLFLEAGTTSINSLEWFTKNTTGSYLTDDQKRQLSNLDNIILSCSFDGESCNSSDFTWVWHPRYYNCYRYNSGFDSNGNKKTLKKVNIAGGLSSFIVELYAGLPNFISNFVGQYNSRGFHIFIHNSTDYFFNYAPSPFRLTPGFGAELTLQRAFYNQFNQWPYGYSECRVLEDNTFIGPPLADSSLFDQVIATNSSYSRDSCILFCAQLMTTQVCKCNSYDIDYRIPGFDLCLEDSKETCASSFWTSTFTKNTYILDHCIPKCPLECNQRIITKNVYYYQYPTLAYAQTTSADATLLQKYPNQTDFTVYTNLYRNMAKLSIFYETLVYVKIEEKAEITFDNLIGTLGGHLHLFLGMSLLSFFEIIELIIISISIHYERKKKRRQITQTGETRTSAPEAHRRAQEQSESDHTQLSRGNDHETLEKLETTGQCVDKARNSVLAHNEYF